VLDLRNKVKGKSDHADVDSELLSRRVTMTRGAPFASSHTATPAGPISL
jgi:hypothetical protein